MESTRHGLIVCAWTMIGQAMARGRLKPTRPSQSEQERLVREASARAAIDVTIVSSMPLAQLVSTETVLIRSVREVLRMRLMVLYDPDPTISTSRIPDGVEAIDLFQAVPALELMTRTGSPIDRLYGWLGFREKMDNGATPKMPAKLLVRKVVAVHYVLTHRVLTGHVLWCDSDIEFVRPLDPRFQSFISKYDFTYMPFKGPGRYAPTGYTEGFADPCWWVESGLMVFAANARAAAITAAAVELYEGGLLRLWDRCGRVGFSSTGFTGQILYKPRFVDRLEPGKCPAFVASHLHANDIYVWSIVAHLIGTQRSGFDPSETGLSGTVCCLEGLLQPGHAPVTQGWISSQTNTLDENETAYTSEWRLDYYAVHHIVTKGALTLQNRADLAHSSAPELLKGSVNTSWWQQRRWDSHSHHPTVVPLKPRIAKCGCQARLPSTLRSEATSPAQNEHHTHRLRKVMVNDMCKGFGRTVPRLWQVPF